jgi:hypothetical protein
MFTAIGRFVFYDHTFLNEVTGLSAFFINLFRNVL